MEAANSSKEINEGKLFTCKIVILRSTVKRLNMQQQTLQEQNDITLHTNYSRTDNTDNLANNTSSENNYFT